MAGGAKMLATRKLNASGPFPERLQNPSVPFGAVLGERFPNTFDKNSGNGHHYLNHSRGESLAAGFLLLDFSLRPIYASEEAVAILAYPEVPSKNKDLANSLQRKVQSLLHSNGSHNGHHNGFSSSKFLNEVASGKRRYQLRAFSMKSNFGIGRGPAVAILLERNHNSPLRLESVARRFRLTPREKETVDLLLKDLSAKQIAGRMNISPNTAKAFLRSVMIKVGAENRTGIIGRILQASNSMNGEFSS
jgi:DNA-binding CsgD family transcriptional regulator